MDDPIDFETAFPENLGCWQIHWCDLSCEAYPQEQNESQKTELNKADSKDQRPVPRGWSTLVEASNLKDMTFEIVQPTYISHPNFVRFFLVEV